MLSHNFNESMLGRMIASPSASIYHNKAETNHNHLIHTAIKNDL